MGDRILPPRSDGELARILERGRELGRRVVPGILRRCAHEPQKLKVTGRGAHSLIVVCSCGSGTLALLVPQRPLSRSETDALVALARESEWS
jgi:hypothetical protein